MPTVQPKAPVPNNPAAVAGGWLAALLFLAVAGLFLPALGHDFITYDDPVYVTKNAHVTGGLSWPDVAWAFRSTEASNWHPLTWLSHMADCQIYGLHPWGHHLTSVLLHALNSVLLFIALRRMTGSVGRSAMVAALFGLHPLHVESVAWIAERKDVLSTTFWMLTLWAYARHVRPADSPAGTTGFPALALGFFCLGLMCKPMLVTLPCVLLLLDFWPLNRWRAGSPGVARRLLIEKIPFFAASAAASAVTVFAQSRGGAVASVADYPWSVRLANALIAYGQYLGKCFVPIKLAVFYPYFAEQPAPGRIALAGFAVAGVTFVALAFLRRRPYLLVGWLWFLGTLVPVIGLIQAGGQSMADRYTYVPLIGIFIMATWGLADAIPPGPRRSRALALAGAGVLAGCAILTSRQLSYWRDGLRLFRHALAVTSDNWVAHANLYATLAKAGAPEAATEFQEMMRILAGFAETYDQKGIALERTPGHSLEAIRQFQTAVQILPVLPEPHYNLGTALARLPGRRPEAIAEFRTAIRLKPDFAAAHFNLGTALAATPEGRSDAIAEFEAAVRLEPGNALAHFQLGLLLSEKPGRLGEALREYQTAISLQPGTYQTHFNLGLLLAQIPGQTDEAIRQFQAALRIRPDLDSARVLIARLQGAAH
jgi:tetratricopeptide (TPR) repeat protein